MGRSSAPLAHVSLSSAGLALACKVTAAKEYGDKLFTSLVVGWVSDWLDVRTKDLLTSHLQLTTSMVGDLLTTVSIAYQLWKYRTDWQSTNKLISRLLMFVNPGFR